MKKSITAIIVWIALLGLVLGGCGEMPIDEPVDDGEVESQSSAVVTPEFRIEGGEYVWERGLLEQLESAISEIRIESLRGDVYELTQDASQSLVLHFEEEENQYVLQGPKLQLPDTGAFVVGLGVESDANCDSEQLWEEESLGLNSMLNTSSLIIEPEDEQSDGKDNDGSPLPLPVEPKSDEEEEDSEQHRSGLKEADDQDVVYTFWEVELKAGEQVMSFVLSTDE